MLKKIYLDVDEEITSVIDKLKGVEETEVSLVVPKESSLLQSVVNLKLIKREAEKLKKTISIITSNKLGRTLAENIGLAVSPGKGEEKKEIDQLGKQPDAEEDGVLISYRDEPKQTKEEAAVSFKKGKIESKHRDDDEISIKEANPEEQTIEETNNDEDKETSSTPEIPKLKNTKTKKKFKLNGFVVALFLAFVALFIFAYIYIPRATVTVTIASQKKAFETDLTVDKAEPDSKVDKGLLAGRLIEVSKETQKKFQSTGKKEIGTKAIGTIVVKNEFSTSSQLLVAGTRFESGGLVYRSLSDATVPGYTDPGTGIVAGTLNVQVEADAPGNKYNIGPSTFTIPGFAGTPKSSKITGSSSAQMSGGESKEISIITQADFTKAKDAITKEAKDELKKALSEKKKEGDSLPDELTEIATGEITLSPSVGEEANEFTVTAKGTAKGLAFNEKDLKEAYVKKTADEAGESREVVKDGYDSKKIAYTKLDLSTGSANINITSDIYLGTRLDQKTIFTELSGQNEAKSLEYLLKQENVKKAEIVFWPSFLKRIPRLEKHVEIKTEAVQEDTKS